MACMLCSDHHFQQKERLNTYIADFLNSPKDDVCKNVLRIVLESSSFPRSSRGKPDIRSVLTPELRTRIGRSENPNGAYRRLSKLINSVNFNSEILCNCVIEKKEAVEREALMNTAWCEFRRQSKEIVQRTRSDHISFKPVTDRDNSITFTITLTKIGFPSKVVSRKNLKDALEQASRQFFSYDLPAATSQNMKSMYKKLSRTIEQFSDSHLIDNFEILWGYKTKINMNSLIRQTSHYLVLVYFHESFNIIRYDKLIKAKNAESLLSVSSKRIRKLMRCMPVIPSRRIHTISAMPRSELGEKDRGGIIITDIEGEELSYFYIANLRAREKNETPTMPMLNQVVSKQVDYNLLYIYSISSLTTKGPKSICKFGIHSTLIDVLKDDLKLQLIKSLKTNRFTRTAIDLNNPSLALFAIYCFPSRLEAARAEAFIKKNSKQFEPDGTALDFIKGEGKTELRKVFSDSGESFIDTFLEITRDRTFMPDEKFEFYDDPVIVDI